LLFDQHMKSIHGIMEPRCFKFGLLDPNDPASDPAMWYRLWMTNATGSRRWMPVQGATVLKVESLTAAIEAGEIHYMPRKAVDLEEYNRTFEGVAYKMDQDQKAEWANFMDDLKAKQDVRCLECIRIRVIQHENGSRRSDAKEVAATKKRLFTKAKNELKKHLLEVLHDVVDPEDCWELYYNRDEVKVPDDGKGGGGGGGEVDGKQEQLDPLMEEDGVYSDQFAKEVMSFGRAQDSALPRLQLGQFVIIRSDIDYAGERFYLGKLLTWDSGAERQANIQYWSWDKQLKVPKYEPGWLGAVDGKASYSIKRPRRVNRYTQWHYSACIIYWGDMGEDGISFLTQKGEIRKRHMDRLIRRLTVAEERAEKERG
jgi:hypothetical protein